MTENKRFTIKQIDNFNHGIKVTDVIMDDGIELPQSTVCDLLNDLSKNNEHLKKQLQEFRVEKSNRINAFCVTNDEYSVVLLKENEAYMVCNMVNRLIKSCKND